MSSIIQRLVKHKDRIISPPSWLPLNLAYECTMGSMAYGTNRPGKSDRDVYGFCLPPKHIVFPHLNGIIQDFGNQGERFHQWQQHHILVPSDKEEYDFNILSIVKFFQLAMDGNPNIVDSLFVPETCVHYATHVGVMVRDARHMFLSKECYVKYRGYAYSQWHKIDIKKPKEGSTRYENCIEYGFDTKFAYHLVRLMLQCEQILEEGTMDLQRNREVLKAIRRGEWTKEQVGEFFESKAKSLDELKLKSSLQEHPSESKIRTLLLNCLEYHYGSLDKCIQTEERTIVALRNIDKELMSIRSVIY